MKRLLLAVLGALAALSVTASVAAADLGGSYRIYDLEVLGGWRATNSYFITMGVSTGAEVLAYRWNGVPWATETTRVSRVSAMQTRIPTPPGATTPPPGVYQLELWLEDLDGSDRGPSAYANFPFDASVPSPALPTAPASWIGDHDAIPISIAHPNPLPLSGVRGYAVSVSPRPDDSPCVDPAGCIDTEIDLPGVANDHLALGPLPEGVDYVHVIAVSGSGVSSPVRSAPIRIDATAPEIRFAGVPPGWVNHPVRVSALAVDPQSGSAAAGPSGPFTTLAIDGRVPITVFGGIATATVGGEGVHRLTGFGRDAVGNTGSFAGGPVATVTIDETPPRTAFASAQLADDPEVIRASVADALSGADPERGAIAIRAAASGKAFRPLPTTVVAGGLSARWNSDDYRPGRYEFRATGFDAAGNSTSTTVKADGSPMLLHNPVKTTTRIESGFGGPQLVWQRCHRAGGSRRCHRETVTGYAKRPATRTVPFGRPLRFGGVLLDVTGRPLGGRHVEIVESFSAGSEVDERRTTVVTGVEGRFGVRLAPGPSRRVSAQFAGTHTLSRSVGTEVGMAVRAGLRFRASTEAAKIGGQPVVFSGRLLSDEAQIPRTGRPIRLEFRLPGGTWSEFRTVQTDRRGRFRYPYAFTDDDSRGIRFQFRAYSPEQAGWPYRPAASAPVAVVGH